jgi:hypothetical protein
LCPTIEQKPFSQKVRVVEQPFTTIFARAATKAFAAVRIQDYWFWVDDRDLRSKRMISFMIVLPSLAESDAPAQVPVVTVGAGG